MSCCDPRDPCRRCASRDDEPRAAVPWSAVRAEMERSRALTTALAEESRRLNALARLALDDLLVAS